MTYQRRVYIPIEYVFQVPTLVWQDETVKDIALTFSATKQKKVKFGVIALENADNLTAVDVVDSQESWFVADKFGNVGISEGSGPIRYMDETFWVNRDAKQCLRVWKHAITCSTLAATIDYPGEKGINRVMQFIESRHT